MNKRAHDSTSGKRLVYVVLLVVAFIASGVTLYNLGKSGNPFEGRTAYYCVQAGGTNEAPEFRCELRGR